MTVIGYTKFKCDRCNTSFPQKGTNPVPIVAMNCGPCANNPAHRGPVSMVPVKSSAVYAKEAS